MTLLLRLAGPTQAWDVHKRRVSPERGHPVTTRYSRADLIPTYSGISGMMAAALGRRRGADMSDLLRLDIVLRVDQPGRARTEFRLTQRRNSTGRAVPQPMAETVLDDAIFLAGVDGDAGLLERISDALDRPQYPLSLGQRAYPITLPLRLTPSPAPAEDAVRFHPWLAAPWYAHEQPTTVSLSILRLQPRERHHDAAVYLAPVTIPNLQSLPAATEDLWWHRWGN